MSDMNGNQNYYETPVRTRTNLVTMIVVAILLVAALAAGIIVALRGGNKNDHTEEINALKESVVSGSSYPVQAEKYFGYLETVTGDNSTITLSDEGEYEGKQYFAVNNDSEYFWTGKIRLYLDLKEVADEAIWLVMPHNYVYITEPTDPMPNKWDIGNSLFLRFTLNEPTFQTDFYESYYDEDGSYYMAYATGDADTTYGNFKSLAIRQYGMNVLMNYLNNDVLLFNKDKVEMYDYGTYREYDPAEASYKATFFYASSKIQLFENQDGSWKEVEWISAD